jgi:hypothetical protein
MRLSKHLIPSLCGLSLLLSPAAFPQSELFRWIGGGPAKNRLDYGMSFHPGRPVAGQGSELGWTVQEGSAYLPLWSAETGNQAALFARARYLDMHGTARFPDLNVSFPPALYDILFGGEGRMRFPNGWSGLMMLGLGSASDRPFYGFDETDISLNAVLRAFPKETGSWIFFLNYSSNREFLRHVPIPGLGYWYAPDRDFQALLGLPFISLQASPGAGFSFRASYFPIHSINARVGFSPLPPLTFYAGFEWVNQRYLRAGREDREDRLFFYEKRVAGGVDFFPFRNGSVNLAGGYAFDRFFFEAESYDDRMENRIDLGDGPFLSFRASLNF